MSYANVNKFIVIEEDDRDPDVSWQHHLERGSAGGVDCVASMRTPVYAPCDGYLVGVWLGTGGLTARISQANGWRDELMHMDQVGPAGPVKQRDLIGYSGASGGAYAPHVHWHRVDPNERRQNPWHYFDSSPAGDSGTIITIESEEDDMKHFYVTDSVDGNDVPGWALLNPRTGKLLTMRSEDANGERINQDRANSWARAWGDASTCTRQDLLNALDAIQKTS